MVQFLKEIRSFGLMTSPSTYTLLREETAKFHISFTVYILF